MNSIAAARARVGHVYRTARTTLAGAALVLTYHRVAVPPSDPQLLAIAPETFDEQMACIADEFHPISAPELCELITAKRRIPKNAVVVTFDDGYFDLLTEALPVLERHGVPGTAFLNTRQIGTEQERWWDELEHLCLGASGLPTRVELAPEGTAPFAFDVAAANDDSAASGSASDGDSGSALWSIASPAVTPAERLYAALCEYLRPLGPESQDRALDELATLLGAARPQRAAYRSLTAREVRELAASGTMTIGAHTASHRFLSAASAEEQAREISEGRNALEDILGRPVELFSYPYGGHDAVDAGAMAAVKDAGLRCGFANWFGLTFPWTDRYAVPRCPTSATGRAEFSRQLREWFSMGR